MLRVKELFACSFPLGKPLWFSLPAFSVHAALDPTYQNSWPPSLVPTWETTGWTGMCFTHLVRSAPVLIRRRESIHGPSSLSYKAESREANFMAANARAPP
jgi:hypothetical protein